MVYATLLSEEDLSRFRTKQCKRLLNGGCNFGLDRCQYSHNEFWNRRCPFYLSDSSFIRYITVMCPDVEVRADGSINSTCLRGGECPFSHSLEEILYHPLFYKTTRCEDYKRGACNTYYCPFIHGLAETRVPGKYKLPFTNGIQIPPIPNVVIVDKIELQTNTHNSSSNREFTNSIENGKGNGNEKELTQKDKERHWKQTQKKRDSRIMEPTEGGMNSKHINQSDNYGNDVGCNGIVGNNIPTLINGMKSNGRKESNGNGTMEDERNHMSLNSDHPFKTSQSVLRHSNGTKPMNSSFATVDNHGNFHSTENLNDLLSNRLSIDTFNGTSFNHSVRASTIMGSYRENETHKSSIATEGKNGDSFCCTDNGRNSFLIPFQNMKMKQSCSSTGTGLQDPTTHVELCVTSEDIDEEEEEEDCSKTFAYLKNGTMQESQKILEPNYMLEKESIYKLENSKENGNKNSELNLLEVVKCLQSLHEKIMKGNLVFTPDQWDMIAQVTYEIIGVVEFNRVMKLKNKQNNKKVETANSILLNGNGIGEPTTQNASNTLNFTKTQNRTNELDMNKDKEKKEVEEIETKKEGPIKESNTNNTNDSSSRVMEDSLKNINFNIKNDNNNNCDRIMMEEKSDIFNFYQQNKNNPFGFDKMGNGLNEKSNNDLCFPVKEENNIHIDKNNHVKDTLFMEYFNLHKDQMNWNDSKENTEKLSAQNQFTSFFSFLSE